MSAPRSSRRRSGWHASTGGTVFYRPDEYDNRPSTADQFPSPLISPRRTRPHAIHIVTYPPGYIPRELRPNAKPRRTLCPEEQLAQTKRRDELNLVAAKPPIKRVDSGLLGKLRASFSGRSIPTLGTLGAADAAAVPPAHPGLDWDQFDRPQTHHALHHSHSHASNMAVSQNAIRPAHQLTAHRNSIMSVRSAKSAVSSFVTEVPKPVATGSGVSCSILLAEQNIFLTGFDHDGHAAREGQTGTALLRGRLQLNVTKNVKIKAVQLKLVGRARTEWPEGIPPLKQEVFEEESLRTQVLTFFNAMNDGWETEYGNQCSYQLKTSSTNSSSTNLALPPKSVATRVLPADLPNARGLTPKELKRLSLQSTQSRSFGKGEAGFATTTQAKGFKVFYPGTYDYSFELPIDHHQLETIKLQYGSVKWELHASVDRAGAFKPNLHGTKEVSIVRLPDQMSLETSEPISISRQWEDQLHYDIVISGKSFPIGSKIPIAFKLTPLAKVQVHKFKVYVTESIEYWTNDKRVTRKDQGRKMLLLEKSAGKPLDQQWGGSNVVTHSGGELSSEQRRQARDVAAARRARAAAAMGRAPEPLPDATNNMLGDLELGLESMWGSTEIEANVQLPTCEMMAKNKELRLNPDCSWKNVNVYHWIKVCFRRSLFSNGDANV